jgi:hypothetical protein
VIAGLVYLRGSCPVSVLDMRTPGGQGTRHDALVWNVAADDAAAKLDEVADGRSSWGVLFWVPLMAGGGEEGVIARWKEVVAARVPDRARRGELAGIALIFAEVSGRVPNGVAGWRVST